jgi:hypothetical protein
VLADTAKFGEKYLVDRNDISGKNIRGFVKDVWGSYPQSYAQVAQKDES